MSMQEEIAKAIDTLKDEVYEDDGYMPISETTKANSLEFVSFIEKAQLPEPVIYGSLEDRIAFSWRKNKNVLLVTVGHDPDLAVSSIINDIDEPSSFALGDSMPGMIKDKLIVHFT